MNDLKSWLKDTHIEKRLSIIKTDEAEQYRNALLRYVNHYQRVHPFDILEEVWLYAQLKLESGHLDFSDIPENILENIEIGCYEYCISLNEVSFAYKIVTQIPSLTPSDIERVINHMLEAFSCNYPEKEFFSRELNNFAEILS
ncbi:hypothetical protein M2263_002045 [Providencia alcalifaciens]|nr:hypothetical protein [Providencia alcalifaciens]